ncbi:MAG: MFS transporter [Blastocatellia bacterium]|nr:MFS transporter [Blastocatellia bacterium]
MSRLEKNAITEQSEPEEEALGRPATFRALRHRNYQLIWIGFFLSNIGTWMQMVAQGWLVRELTPSTTLIGLVTFAGSFPQLAFSLFGGAYADLFNRRKLLIGTQTLHLFNAAALGLLVLLRDAGLWTGLSLWHVILFTFSSGLASTLATPAFQALTLDLVGREDLPSAVALNSAQYNLSRIIGPTIGGVFFSALGIAGCYFLNSASFLAVITALWLMRLPDWQAPEERHPREMLRQTVAGLRYVHKRPRVQALLAIAAMVSLCGLPYLIFLPVFARDVLRTDARGLAWLWAATGGGALVSALVMAYSLSNSRRRGRWLVVGNVFFGVAILAFSVSRRLPLSCLSLMFVGGGMVWITTTVNTLLQMLVRDEMRGRVMSMYSLAFLGLPPLGGLLIGLLADAVGARGGFHGMQWALALGGALIALFAGFIAVAVPRVRELE